MPDHGGGGERRAAAGEGRRREEGGGGRRAAAGGRWRLARGGRRREKGGGGREEGGGERRAAVGDGRRREAGGVGRRAAAGGGRRWREEGGAGGESLDTWAPLEAHELDVVARRRHLARDCSAWAGAIGRICGRRLEHRRLELPTGVQRRHGPPGGGLRAARTHPPLRAHARSVGHERVPALGSRRTQPQIASRPMHAAHLHPARQALVQPPRPGRQWQRGRARAPAPKSFPVTVPHNSSHAFYICGELWGTVTGIGEP